MERIIWQNGVEPWHSWKAVLESRETSGDSIVIGKVTTNVPAGWIHSVKLYQDNNFLLKSSFYTKEERGDDEEEFNLLIREHTSILISEQRKRSDQFLKLTEEWLKKYS